MDNKRATMYSYYSMRKIIGILGMLLPFIVIAFHGDILSSISNYYYTKSTVFFIAILSTFGLFLISYQGYKKDKKTEKLSDNAITLIAGIAMLIVVFFPTSCINSNSYEINKICLLEDYPLFGHSNPIIKTIHLISAGIFFFTMGWMSIFRFTKGKRTPEKLMKIKIYRFCGFTVWVCIGILLIEFIIKKFYPDFYITNYDVFILETISLVIFGISWLVKGEAQSNLYNFKNKYFKTSDLKTHKL